MRRKVLLAAAPAIALLIPAGAQAQVANPLPQAVGMGGNYTVLARGIAAPAWNPAGLGMPDNPAGSFTFLPMVFTVGLEPVSVSDLAAWQGELITREQKLEWLDVITQSGGESGTFGTDITFMALSVGRLALSASNGIRGRVNMAPDVAKVLFFGNAGFTGDPEDYTLAGSNFDLAGTTTVAASLGVPLSLRLGPLPDQHFALGATLKYTLGNFLVLGQEGGSAISSNPVAVDFQFPMVHTTFPDSAQEYDIFQDVLNNGSGIGVDVGASWQSGIFAAGLVVKNVVNTFAWDKEALHYRQGTATWNMDTTYTDFEQLSIEQAPAELTDRIDELYTFAPVMAAGAAVRLRFLTVTGEIRHSLEDNLDVGGRNHMGVGAELTIIPFLPIRAGVSLISGGYQLSGGLGLKLGRMQLTGGGAFRDGARGDNAVAAIGVTFGVR